MNTFQFAMLLLLFIWEFFLICIEQLLKGTVNKKFQVSSLQGEQGYTGGLRNHRKDAWYSGIAC
jgi:hypothetical protein